MPEYMDAGRLEVPGTSFFSVNVTIDNDTGTFSFVDPAKIVPGVSRCNPDNVNKRSFDTMWRETGYLGPYASFDAWEAVLLLSFKSYWVAKVSADTIRSDRAAEWVADIFASAEAEARWHATMVFATWADGTTTRCMKQDAWGAHMVFKSEDEYCRHIKSMNDLERRLEEEEATRRDNNIRHAFRHVALMDEETTNLPMGEGLYDLLCHVHDFQTLNGDTYVAYLRGWRRDRFRKAQAEEAAAEEAWEVAATKTRDADAARAWDAAGEAEVKAEATRAWEVAGGGGGAGSP